MPVQTHLMSRELKACEDLHVLFSANPTRKAILFIHGYNGHSLNTWSDFHILLPQCPRFAGYDLYFYGYDGLRAPVTASASLFRQLLEDLFSRTSEIVNETLPADLQRADDFAYDEFIIAAHSLGAVVTRRALVDATRTDQDWVNRIKLVLYAPAHMGANIGKLALETVSSFKIFKWFSSAARIVSPLIDELDPQKSDLLKKLQETTLELLEDDKNPHLVAKKVVWAEQENVVINEDFAKDPLGQAIRNSTHTSICKPNADFREPLTCLEECL